MQGDAACLRGKRDPSYAAGQRGDGRFSLVGRRSYYRSGAAIGAPFGLRPKRPSRPPREGRPFHEQTR
jgi:hypothetical protein